MVRAPVIDHISGQIKRITDNPEKVKEHMLQLTSKPLKDNKRFHQSFPPFVCNFLLHLLEAAEEVFPNRVQMTFDLQAKTAFTDVDVYGATQRERYICGFGYTRPKLEIHFPEIILTNADEENYLLTDLYVALVFDSAGGGDIVFPTKLKGRRGTVTETEYRSGYQHSHISSIDNAVANPAKFLSYYNFCMGDGDLAKQLADFRLRLQDTESAIENSYVNAFPKEELLLLFLQVQNFVSYESKAGGAYVYFHDLANAKKYVRESPINFSSEKSKRYFDIFIAYLKDKRKRLDLQWTHNGTKWRITSVIALEKLLMEALGDMGYPAVVCRASDGEYYKELSSLPNVDITSNPSLYTVFKGEKRTFNIIKAEEEPDTLVLNKVINYHISHYVKRQLEDSIAEAKVTNLMFDGQAKIDTHRAHH